MADDPNAAERDRLQRLLDASENQPGYADRVKAIKAAMEKLDDDNG